MMHLRFTQPINIIFILISAKINPFHYVDFPNGVFSLVWILYKQYFTSEDFILTTLAGSSDLRLSLPYYYL